VLLPCEPELPPLLELPLDVPPLPLPLDEPPAPLLEPVPELLLVSLPPPELDPEAVPPELELAVAEDPELLVEPPDPPPKLVVGGDEEPHAVATVAISRNGPPRRAKVGRDFMVPTFYVAPPRAAGRNLPPSSAFRRERHSPLPLMESQVA
jgi:hypothetical protein